jgi:hypothetical protein
VVRQDGCTDHQVSPGAVAQWWAIAQKQSVDVSMCACCLSPCPIDSPVCKFCAAADLDVLRRGGGGIVEQQMSPSLASEGETK